jgi:hypothetical protein
MKFDELVNKILEQFAYYPVSNDTLYLPTKKATRGKDIGMTQVDPSKTFPATDKTLVLPFPKDKKRKQAAKQ